MKQKVNANQRCQSSIYTQVRIDDKTFLKGKILAAVYDESFNHLMVRAVRNEIRTYKASNEPSPEPIVPKEI